MLDQTTVYYLITTEYIGPDIKETPDNVTIEIHDRPMRTIMDDEVCTEGWCGTQSDVSTYAHGAYPTLEAAREAITERFGVVRSGDANGDPFPVDDERVIEWYKPGALTPLSAKATAEIMGNGWDEVTAWSTDDEIETMTEEAIRALREQLEVDPDEDAVRNYYHDRRRAEQYAIEEDEDNLVTENHEFTIDDARALVDNETPASGPEVRERYAQEVMRKVREEGEGAERALMQIRGLGS